MNFSFDSFHHIRWNFRKVNQSRNSSVKFQENSKLRKTENWCFDNISNLIFISKNLPRICFQSLDRKRDFFSFDTNNLNSYLVTNTSVFMRVVHVSPINFRNMYKTFNSVECNEQTIRQNSRNRSFYYITNLHCRKCL